MKKIFQMICTLLIGALLPVSSNGELLIASLSPVVTALAREVGGEHVRIIELLKPGRDPHTFAPSPADLRAARDAKLILASGKGMESYLNDFRDGLEPGQTLVEVGRTIPSLRIDSGKEMFVCCPAHANGALDPHWWHSVRNAQRATRVLADAFAEADPDHAEDYHRQYQIVSDQLEALHKWVRKEVSTIPRRNRKLTTAHLAFAYFCREYGFQSIPVQGLSTEDNPHPQYLAEVVDTLRKNHIRAVFPEVGANPKVLESMLRETGVHSGRPLLANGPHPDNPTYESMMRYNVEAMVEALK